MNVTTAPYEELVEGCSVLRLPVKSRHEEICARLHAAAAAALAQATTSRLLPMRAAVSISHKNRFCPDLALLTVAHGKLWLAAEVISSDDHHADTVEKKGVYEQIRLARLWMVDPRYDNIEVYHATPYGMTLKFALTTKDVLEEPLLPGFQCSVSDLFAVSHVPRAARKLGF